MKNFKTGLLWIAALSLLASCTKSGALTGTSGGASGNTTVSGSVSGGLSPISGALVSLMVAGKSTPIATATTSSTGAYTLNYTNPGSGLLYVTVSGGNAGSGTNSKIALMATLGPAASVPSSLNVNEVTTAATSAAAFNMGLLSDSSGTVTVSAPNSESVGNIATQVNNLITSPGATTINSGNSNVTTAMTNTVYAMANAMASCIENSANCSGLMNAAQSTTGAAAVNLFDALNNMLTNSTNTATPVYNLAAPVSTSTGLSLPGGIPGGFSFNVALPVTMRTLTGFSAPFSLAFDASGNAWINNFNGNTVSWVSPSGALLGTFSVSGTQPIGMAIDAAGNVWITYNGSSTVTELSSSGSLVATISIPSHADGIVIDSSGNVWVALSASFQLVELSSSGATLQTPTTSGSNNAKEGIVADASGFIWSTQGNNYYRLSPSGSTVFNTSIAGGLSGLVISPSGTLWGVAPSSPALVQVNSGGVTVSTISTSGITPQQGLTIDPSGNLWTTDTAGTTVREYSPSGILMASYTTTATNDVRGISIDPSGNVWVLNKGANTVSVLTGATNGPMFFPYSGPVWPYGF